MEVRVEFSYPKLEFVSDRTFRESLKLASQQIHKIHLDEVLYVLQTSALSDRVKQSAQDRIALHLDHIPNYYIETVRRGSLTVLVTLSAAAYFILQKTLGKTIESAWERTPTHKRLVRFLSNTSTAEEAQSVPGRISKPVSDNLGPRGERWQWLEREFSFHFLNNPRFGRFKVRRLDFEEEQTHDMLVRIEFMLAEEHLELEGTFRQYLYKDFINQFESKPSGEKQKRTRKRKR